jgi:hypothetical protein
MTKKELAEQILLTRLRYDSRLSAEFEAKYVCDLVDALYFIMQKRRWVGAEESS